MQVWFLLALHFRLQWPLKSTLWNFIGDKGNNFIYDTLSNMLLVRINHRFLEVNHVDFAFKFQIFPLKWAFSLWFFSSFMLSKRKKGWCCYNERCTIGFCFFDMVFECVLEFGNLGLIGDWRCSFLASWGVLCTYLIPKSILITLTLWTLFNKRFPISF